MCVGKKVDIVEREHEHEVEETAPMALARPICVCRLSRSLDEAID